MSILQKYVNINLDSHFEKLNDEAFVYHNFLSKYELKEIMDEINSSKIKGSLHIKSLKKYEERVKSLFTGQKIWFDMEDMGLIERRDTEAEEFVHIDILNHMNPVLDWVVDSNFKGKKMEINMSVMAFIIYLNDNYEGGELYYPDYGTIYKPKAGDLCTHYTEVPHGVTTVKSGVRFSHANFIETMFYIDEEKFEKNYVRNEEPGNYKLESNASFLHEKSTSKRMRALQKSIYGKEIS